mgnify:CR=1 FL=1
MDNHNETRMEFPFLIGKVLTHFMRDGVTITYNTRFPFLIGKVLTRVVGEERLTMCVSIPYR